MKAPADKSVCQSITLPGMLAAQVRGMAKTRRLSPNRMPLELIEDGIEADKRKQQEFFALVEQFRNENDPTAAKRLGDKLAGWSSAASAANRELGEPAPWHPAAPDRPHERSPDQHFRPQSTPALGRD